MELNHQFGWSFQGCEDGEEAKVAVNFHVFTAGFLVETSFGIDRKKTYQYIDWKEHEKIQAI